MECVVDTRSAVMSPKRGKLLLQLLAGINSANNITIWMVTI